MLEYYGYFPLAIMMKDILLHDDDDVLVSQEDPGGTHRLLSDLLLNDIDERVFEL